MYHFYQNLLILPLDLRYIAHMSNQHEDRIKKYLKSNIDIKVDEKVDPQKVQEFVERKLKPVESPMDYFESQ